MKTCSILLFGIILSLLLSIVVANASTRKRFSNSLDGLNLLFGEHSLASSNIEMLVDIHVKDVILTDSSMAQLNQIIFGVSTHNKLTVVSGTANRVFRTRLSSVRISEIRNRADYYNFINKIERVSNENRVKFPEFSMDSLRFSNIKVVMSESYENTPTFLMKISRMYSTELSTKLSNLQDPIRRSKDFDVDILQQSMSISFARDNIQSKLFSISLENFNHDLWTKNENRVELMSHMSDFLLENILSNENVEFVEREFTQQLLTFGANNVVQFNSKTNNTRFSWDNGVTGKGEVVQVIDSGLDYSHCYFSGANENYMTFNTNNRKIALYERGKFGDRMDGNGHGTHVCGIILGYPEKTSSTGFMQDIGIAKDAKIHMVDTSSSIISGVENITIYLDSAYLEGVRISSNSWGNTNSLECLFDCDCYEAKTNYTKPVTNDYCLKQYGLKCCQLGNSYEVNAGFVDEFTYSHDEMLVVFAAGNSGTYGSEGSVIAPSLAKNCISVGASYANSVEYTRYATVDTTLYNQQNMGHFSARGKTFDNRFKPDIVAPGVGIWSAIIDVPFCDNSGLTQKSGTSMAAPAVSGTAALVREYFLQNNKQRLINFEIANKDPSQTLSGMLVKAFLIHSAEKMTGIVKLDGKFTNSNHYHDLSQETIPNKYMGYGRVNVGNLMKFSSNDQNPDLFVINRQRLDASKNATINIRIMKSANSNGNPFKVTLTWYDQKSANTNKLAKQLINDLDLSMTIRDDSSSDTTTICYGNQPNCVYQQKQEQILDDLNNVEAITMIPNFSSYGNSSYITLQIKASDKNVGSQSFALIISGYDLQVDSVYIPPLNPSTSTSSNIFQSNIIFLQFCLVMSVLIACSSFF